MVSTMQWVPTTLQLIRVCYAYVLHNLLNCCVGVWTRHVRLWRERSKFNAVRCLLTCADVLPGQSPWPLLPLRLLSVSKRNCCGGLCHQVHPLHCGSHCVHNIWSADKVHTRLQLNSMQWNLSIEDTTGTHLAVLYTVEPLYRGQHWDPAGYPVYSGTSL